jgi:hypothetical protein
MVMTRPDPSPKTGGRFPPHPPRRLQKGIANADSPMAQHPFAPGYQPVVATFDYPQNQAQKDEKQAADQEVDHHALPSSYRS